MRQLRDQLHQGATRTFNLEGGSGIAKAGITWGELKPWHSMPGGSLSYVEDATTARDAALRRGHGVAGFPLPHPLISCLPLDVR